ncbi:peptidylprolyl isomerase [Halocola ammonii]
MKKISSTQEAEIYSENHPTWLAHIYNISKSDSLRYSKVLDMEIGEVFLYHDNHRDMDFAGKVLSRNRETVFDIQYIYLDGHKLDSASIDSIRTEIIKKFKSGTSFDSLVREYSIMRDKHNGKLLEVRPNMLVEDFDQACREHETGDVFTIDIPENNWYHVVLILRKEYEIIITKFLSVKYTPL